MPKFKNIIAGIEVNAIQWFKNGDHPDDNCEKKFKPNGLPFLGEGKVVKYYRSHTIDSLSKCTHCLKIMHRHGLIDIKGSETKVCPGDWIVELQDGERFISDEHYFYQLYELIK